MDWRTLPIVAFDTETTGLNPHDSDRIIEFAAVVFQLDERGRVDERRTQRHEMLFNPEIPIPPKVVQLTGITDEAVAKAPPFAAKAHEIRRLLAQGICVAHNFPFDRAFLAAELERCGLTWPDPVGEVDTVDLSMKVYPDAQSHKLSELARRVDVRLDNAHRATADAEACGRAFVAMALRENAPEELQGMLEWAEALGHPPDNPLIAVNADGVVVFRSGEHSGEPVEHHPVVLHWMTMARERREGHWHYRYPESLRRWASRFLKVRGAGRARQNPKSFGPQDWGQDSNALPLPDLPA